MEFSRRGTDRTRSWADWERENVVIADDAVRIAPDPLPAYHTLEAELAPETAEPFVDLAVDRCGQVFLLTADGRIYRYTPDAEDLVRVDCGDEELADARAIAVTTDSIYVASGKPGRVRTYSRHVGGIRWTATDGVDEPVTFVRIDGEVHLLDRGAHPGMGGVRRIEPDGSVEAIVTGLFEPIDVDADPDGDLYVLEPHVWADAAEGAQFVVREIPAQAIAHPPVPAVDTVWIPPEAFRAGASGDPVSPACLAAGDRGELVVGTAPDGPGERALFSFRPERATFEFQSAVPAGCTALAVDRTADPTRLYVIDATGEVFLARAEPATRLNRATGGFDGRVRTRFDAGETGMQWHRVRLTRAGAAADTQVALRYHATDAAEPDRLSRDPERVSTDLTLIGGIGSRKAWRLRRAGIRDVAALAASDPETVAAIVSVEEIHVPADDVAEWQSAAESLLASGEEALEAVDGIGPVFGERLRAADVETLAAFVDLSPAVVSALLGSRLRTISTDRTADWIADAAALLADPPTPTALDWQELPPDPQEALLADATGRYLWVEVELVGTASATPIIDGIEVSYPRRSYLDELPAVYRADAETSAFLEPFLALFESVLTEFEEGIADVVRYLDPDGIPGEPGHLAWLGSWLATEMDEGWPASAKRDFIDAAPDLYRMRGTRRGLQELIDLYLEHVDVDLGAWARDEEVKLARVIEHADLDCATGEAREPYARLISCPQGFLVLLHPALATEHQRAIGRIVGHQRPAHTSGRAVALRPLTVLTGHDRGERGFHTYLGINTVLPSREFQLETATLGQQTVLTEHEPHGAVGIRARLDEDARLS